MISVANEETNSRRTRSLLTHSFLLSSSGGTHATRFETS